MRGAATELVGLAFQLPCALCAGAVVDEHVAARGQQVAGDGMADALTARGDERPLPRQPVHRRSRRLSHVHGWSGRRMPSQPMMRPATLSADRSSTSMMRSAMAVYRPSLASA